METVTTKFGFGQIPNPTPMWAKTAFRIFFYTTSAVALTLTVFTEIPSHIKEEILKGTTLANMLAHGLSKMFGIEIETTDFFK